MYGIRFMNRNQSPSHKEDRAQYNQPSNESLITEKKLFMIECKIELLNILQSSSIDHQPTNGNLLTNNCNSNTNNNNSSSLSLSAEGRIKYYSDQLEEAKKIVQDLKFIQLVMNESNLDVLERLKIQVVDPEEEEMQKI
ncbi:predicted protein [Naegleria gruberi]|uniref:Predicted protein n=1 Tax=Naegleria gruberi TaxID=5762 RepID=D2VSX5_NAEGR|nr:uncharacterized protein NAEGRDRAFT_72095 [Naegleria gruberi]EFC39980.1 predicted protein [Naegleria gruberi]|eukprot:XP_002672724.1 predicted protein [Naegleria gruberi strain NEG-M]